MRAGVAGLGSKRAEIIDDFRFGRVGIRGSDNRHDHGLSGPQELAATPDVPSPNLRRTRRHADRSRRSGRKWRRGDAVDGLNRRRRAVYSTASLVQVEPVRPAMRQPRTAAYGLVSQKIEPKSAVKLKPSFVHQQARRDSDARRNPVAEKILRRRRRHVDKGADKG